MNVHDTPAETLRRAAALIRHDVLFGQAPNEPFMLAVAKWLDGCADFREAAPALWKQRQREDRSDPLAVARAYLGGSDVAPD